MKHFNEDSESAAEPRLLRHGIIASTSLAILMACAPSRAATPDIPRAKAPPKSSSARPDAPQTTGASTAQTRQLARQASPEDALSVDALEARARKRETAHKSYPYHSQSRRVRGKVKCPKIEVISYEGSLIPYNQPIEINPHFKDRLVRFERLVMEVAVRVYERAPAQIVHFGGHSCKTVSGRGKKFSEHVFGHAIDISGFKFDAAADADTASDAAVDGAFTVTLKEHWGATDGFGAKHAQFLRELADVLKKRGPFSTMLGPAYPGHDSLFHFDFGPQFFFRI